MVLAAGLGTRLRPLTDRLPKPLLPIAGRPMIDYTLAWVAAAGIQEVMINLHHLGDRIREVVGHERFGLKISYSDEAAILGTGGGLKRVERFLADSPFLVINADVLTAVDPRAVIRAHLAQQPLATLVVRRDPEVAAYGALGIDHQGRICRFLGHGPQGSAPIEDVMFTGIHVVDPRVLGELPPAGVFSPITDAYIALVERGAPLMGYLTDSPWLDIGTPERYRQAEQWVSAGLIPRPADQPLR